MISVAGAILLIHWFGRVLIEWDYMKGKHSVFALIGFLVTMMFPGDAVYSKASSVTESAQLAKASKKTKKDTPKDTTEKKAKKPKDPRVWNESMVELSEVFGRLLPMVVNDKKFHDPKNRDQLKKDVEKLTSLAHGMDKDLKNQNYTFLPDSDMTIEMISDAFKKESSRALSELKKGHMDYAQSLLKQVSNFCISCHTRNQFGPDFQTLDIETDMSSLGPLEKANFLAATRQFDRALNAYRKVIKDTNFLSSQRLNWERALGKALLIAVRVRRNPGLGIEIIDEVLALNEKVPTFIQNYAKSWRGSLVSWKKEPQRQDTTEEGLFAEAQLSFTRAKAKQKYPFDRSAEVDFMRVSSLIHQLLRRYPKGERVPEALYMAGVSYEALQDLDWWSFHEMYYEQCIKKSPHSPIAQRCYARYEESVYLGYSGSSGVSIPEEVRQRLDKLQKLAKKPSGKTI